MNQITEDVFNKSGLIGALLFGLLFPSMGHSVASDFVSQPRLKQLTVNDGLPSQGAYDVAQDSKGIMWFATMNGVARYDGRRFASWGRKDGLPSSFTWRIDLDEKDRVWVATQNGLGVIDALSGRAKTITPAKGEDPVGNVYALASDHDGSVWFSNTKRLYRTFEGGQTELVKSGDSRIDNVLKHGVYIIRRFSKGHVLLVTLYGIVDWKEGRFSLRESPREDELQSIDSSYFEPGVGLWINSPDNFAIAGINGSWKRMPFGKMITRVNGRERGGAYWVGDKAKIWRYVDGRLEEPVVGDMLGSQAGIDWVSGLKSSDGSIWFTTLSNGVWRLPPGWKKGYAVGRFGANSKIMEHPQIVELAARGGRYAVALNNHGQIIKIDLLTGKPRILVDDDRLIDASGILQDSDGLIWIFSTQRLLRISSDGKILSTWTASSKENPIPASGALWFTEDGQGRIWTMGGTGEIQARSKDGSIVEKIPSGSKQGRTHECPMRGLTSSADGSVFSYSTCAVYRWNDQFRRFVKVVGIDVSSISTVSFGNQPASDVFVAHDGGVSMFREDGKTYRILKQIKVEESNLPESLIYTMMVDEGDVVWGGSSEGLIRMDFSTGGVRVFGTSDGLGSREVSTRIAAGQGTTAVIGTAAGFFVFDRMALAPSPVPPTLLIDQISSRSSSGQIDFHSPSLQLLFHIPRVILPSPHEFHITMGWRKIASASDFLGLMSIGRIRVWMANGYFPN